MPFFWPATKFEFCIPDSDEGIVFLKFVCMFETPALAYNVYFHLLDHVKNRLIFPQPDVMIGNCHPLKGNTLCVLEK